MWIQEYREREKLELWQFQQRVNEYGKRLKEPFYGTISAQLIHMLEVDKNAVTHPRIANAIATLCEATPNQRDLIVAEPHKGNWNGPTQNESRIAEIVNAKIFVKGIDYHKTVTVSGTPEKQKPYIPNTTKPVVKIDVLGNVVKRYDGAKQASLHEPVEKGAIKRRCQRYVKKEFVRYFNGQGSCPKKYTFRYADEWDKMTEDERAADMKRALEAETVQ